MIDVKIISSGDKAFADQQLGDFETVKDILALQGETVSFQLLFRNDGSDRKQPRPFGNIAVEGALAPYATLRDVRNVPVERPVEPGKTDAHYLRTEPGLYPDILTPLRYKGKIVAAAGKLRSVWVDVEIPFDYSGSSDITVKTVFPTCNEEQEASISITVLPIALSQQKTHFTQWFYCDGLANYYNLPVWSERHWEIIENFARVAVKRGRDTLYTPLLTPALNTLPEYERTTTQLVRIIVEGGKYSFDFSLLDRWIDMCDRIGVKYLEISHLFEQDQAKHAAKIYATVDGEYQRLFGWETESLDERYVVFLRAMLTAFVDHMKKRGDDKRCFYHISDEPSLKNLDHYIKVKEIVADILDGYVLMDALSNYEFYKTGAVSTPVPTTHDVMPFVENGVEDLWVYYACNQLVEYSNSYLAMPNFRTRSIGMQLFKYNIKGFLHWGYNYYNNRGSGDGIVPYMDLSGEDWVPAGDTFAVYPAPDGTPYESMRMMALEEAMQDLRAMELAASLASREQVISAMEQILGEPITFTRCAHSASEMTAVRNAVNAIIASAVKK